MIGACVALSHPLASCGAEVPACRPEDSTGARCTPGTPGCSYANCQQEVNCGHPGVLYNGWLEGIEGGTMLGASIIFRCQEGMTMFGNASTVCQLDGTWRYPLPKCLGESQVLHGPTLAHCKDGYTLRGPSTSVCAFGSWTGEMPYCQEVYCPFPGYIENGKVMLVGNMGLYDYRPYVRKVTNNKQIMYDCDRGYVLADGPVGATCVGGRWSPKDLPRCVPGQHPRLRWSREVHEKKAEEDPKMAALIARWEALQRSKRSVFLSRMLPRLTSRAKRDTTDWDYPSYPAQPHEEDEPANWMDRMQAAQAHSKTVATKVGTLDKKGKGKNKNRGKSGGNRGNRNRNKDVDETAAFCEPIREAPYINVTVVKPVGENVSSNALGSVVRIECTQGYSPTLFNRTGRCVRGAWKPRTPDCVVMNCEVPPIESGRYTLHGHVVNTNDTVKTFHTIELGCNRGYNMHGPTSLYCLHGEWTASDFPSCEPGYRAGLTIAHGATVNYQCEPEYSRNPNKPVECLHGELRPNPPSCRLKGGANIYATQRPEIGVDGASILLGGSNYMTTEDYGELDFPHNMSCTFRNTEPNLIYFFNDQPITEEMVEFPPGTELEARCTDIGKYSMTGSNRRVCQGGEWDGHKPHKPACFGLNQENDYALEKPPTILFRHQLGPIAQSNDGKLIVSPGTILHMECLWIRRFGTPKWNVSHSYRIMHATGDDSGTFTCITPTRHTHSVEIVVKLVHCPMLTPRRGMTLSTKITKMNTRVTFTCQNGEMLIGTEEIVCLPSGNWSAPVPVCEAVECPDSLDVTEESHPNLRVTIQSQEAGGRAIFTCTPGYGLRGPSESICQSDGKWSDPIPICHDVKCEHPGPIENGMIQGDPTNDHVYKSGDMIQIICKQEFKLEGTPILACQETGRWSSHVPKCVKACSYPGTTINGRIETVKFYYQLGETVKFSCDPGHELRGPEMLECVSRKNRLMWSSAIPTCVPLNTRAQG
ncbi:hypothetical protein B566_EDAN011893 [Ephemera danica]|nr:hypothetical protein B566_EDAN011893 [Ephemera danica]